MTGICEHGKETSDFIKIRKLLNQVSSYQRLIFWRSSTALQFLSLRSERHASFPEDAIGFFFPSLRWKWTSQPLKNVYGEFKPVDKDEQGVNVTIYLHLILSKNDAKFASTSWRDA
jgi:hypothetical protein